MILHHQHHHNDHRDHQYNLSDNCWAANWGAEDSLQKGEKLNLGEEEDDDEDDDDDGQSRQAFECWSFLMSVHSVDTNIFYQIASIAATRVESMRDLLIRYFKKMIVMIMNTITMITMMNIITTRWEEMSISGEKDTMDFQPLTQFLKCYAIYFASWTKLLSVKNTLIYSPSKKHSHLLLNPPSCPTKLNFISVWIHLSQLITGTKIK